MSRSEVVPLEPDREWDLSQGPHVGHGAALRVPISEGPASYVLDRGETSDRALIEAEPSVDPARWMECGTEWSAEAIACARSVDVPIHKPDWL